MSHNNSQDEPQIPPPLKEIFGSKGRIRALRVLAEAGELSISEISGKTGLNNHLIRQYMAVVIKAGIVKEKKFGKLRIYEFVKDSPRSQMLKRLFDAWETIDA